MKCIKRAFPPRHNQRINTAKITTILALFLAAGLKLLPSAHAQTRIYDFPLGGTCYELSVVTNSHGSTHTTLVPYPFCPIDPSFTPLYSVDDAGICIFSGPEGGRYIGEPAFYIVHWDGSDLISRGIPLLFYSSNVLTSVGEIEGALFAPTNFPAN